MKQPGIVDEPAKVNEVANEAAIVDETVRLNEA